MHFAKSFFLLYDYTFVFGLAVKYLFAVFENGECLSVHLYIIASAADMYFGKGDLIRSDGHAGNEGKGLQALRLDSEHSLCYYTDK